MRIRMGMKLRLSKKLNWPVRSEHMKVSTLRYPAKNGPLKVDRRKWNGMEWHERAVFMFKIHNLHLPILINLTTHLHFRMFAWFMRHFSCMSFQKRLFSCWICWKSECMKVREQEEREKFDLQLVALLSLVSHLTSRHKQGLQLFDSNECAFQSFNPI